MMSVANARTRGGLNYYDSETFFVDMVEKLIDVEITEFILHYPYRYEQLPMFERIAREAITELKERCNN